MAEIVYNSAVVFCDRLVDHDPSVAKGNMAVDAGSG